MNTPRSLDSRLKCNTLGQSASFVGVEIVWESVEPRLCTVGLEI